MNAGEILQLFRSEMVDSNIYFPIDRDLYHYMNEGYREIVRLSGGIEDIMTLDYSAGEYEVDIPTQVIKFRRILNESDELTIINYTEIDHTEFGKEGELRTFVTGNETQKAWLIGTPVATGELTAYVQRYPLSKLTSETSKLSEIPEHFHPAVVEWMKYRAFSRPQNGLNNPSFAKHSMDQFLAIVDAYNRANSMLRHKTRVVMYGGI